MDTHLAKSLDEKGKTVDGRRVGVKGFGERKGKKGGKKKTFK